MRLADTAGLCARGVALVGSYSSRYAVAFGGMWQLYRDNVTYCPCVTAAFIRYRRLRVLSLFLLDLCGCSSDCAGGDLFVVEYDSLHYDRLFADDDVGLRFKGSTLLL